MNVQVEIILLFATTLEMIDGTLRFLAILMSPFSHDQENMREQIHTTCTGAGTWYQVPGTYLALTTILLLCHSSSLVVMKIHVVRGIPVLYSVYTYIDYTVYVNLHRGIILGSPRPRYGGTGTGTRSTAYTGMYHSRLQFCTSIPIV